MLLSLVRTQTPISNRSWVGPLHDIVDEIVAVDDIGELQHADHFRPKSPLPMST